MEWFSALGKDLAEFGKIIRDDTVEAAAKASKGKLGAGGSVHPVATAAPEDDERRAATRKALERAQEEVEKDLEDLGWGDDEDAVAPGSEEDADAAFAPEETLPGELQATEGADANSDGVDAMPVPGATEGADGAAAGPCPAQPAEDQATTAAASTPAAAALSDAAAEVVTGQADDLAGSVGGDAAPLPAAAPAAADHQPS